MTQSPKPPKTPYAESLAIAGFVTLVILIGLPLSQILSDSISPPDGPQVEPIPYEPPPDMSIEPPDPPDPQKDQIEEMREDPPPLTIGMMEVLINPDLSSVYHTDMAGILPSVGIQDIVHDISDLTREPRPLRQNQPVYPPPLRTAKVNGMVALKFVVDKNGTTRDIQVLQASNPEFERAAVRAVRNWVFEPGEKDGKPVHSWVRIEIPFRVN